jgi:hypothetical protein
MDQVKSSREAGRHQGCCIRHHEAAADEQPNPTCQTAGEPVLAAGKISSRQRTGMSRMTRALVAAPNDPYPDRKEHQPEAEAKRPNTKKLLHKLFAHQMVGAYRRLRWLTKQIVALCNRADSVVRLFIWIGTPTLLYRCAFPTLTGIPFRQTVSIVRRDFAFHSNFFWREINVVEECFGAVSRDWLSDRYSLSGRSL